MPVPLDPIGAWMDNVALAALSSRETLWATWELAGLLVDIAGDFVECGVFGGAQLAAMAYWDALRPFRKVHGFDTFTGVPASGVEDSGWTHPPGISACSLQAVKDHLVEWSLPLDIFEFHEGQFADTVPKAHFPNGIALLRLDGDLYQSTKDALGLLKYVNQGGWVIVDDFALPGCRKAILESELAQGPAYFKVGPR